jgi:hypothetical protein
MVVALRWTDPPTKETYTCFNKDDISPCSRVVPVTVEALWWTEPPSKESYHFF